MQRKGRPLRQPPLTTQLVDLFLVELTNWRWSWRSLLLTATLPPLLSILALGIFARDSGPAALSYVLTGNAVISLMFGNMNNVQGHFAFMRFQGVLEYFATLPIRRPMLILAVLLAFFLLHLPAVTVTILLGSFFLRVPLSVHPVILLVIPACAVSLSGIGALVGVQARTPQEADAWSFLGTLIMAGLGPVVIPPDRLPPVLLLLGRLSPATYAASALRQALLGPLTGQIVVDLLVLVGLGGVTFWIVGHRMDWRQA
jgi:ABC-2 type transport system permease protein